MSRINDGLESASFRDPSGFIFFQDGEVYRQVNNVYKEHYDCLMESGLYRELVDEGLMVSHEEVSDQLKQSEDAYKVIKPQPVDFISYPNEWSFSQLKDAALTTLAIQKKAFAHGMVLKDSSAFNIQFVKCRPIFIDSLSFEKYRQGRPWVAYKQFCQHFLAPLSLMSYTDVRLGQLFRVYIDGIPLDLASKLLPIKSWLKFSSLTHIHLHAKTQGHYADKAVSTKTRKMSKLGFMGIIDSLENAVKKLRWLPKGTEWGDYYNGTNYSNNAMTQKERLVAEFINKINPKMTWDIGANTGLFSKIAARKSRNTVSFDIDPAAIEKNYLDNKDGDLEILPLVLDLTNPNSAMGWENSERMSLTERGPADAAMALALIHHLAISNNVPLTKVAQFFAKICRSLIIEFVPKEDSQVKRLLATREDIFPDYHKSGFERAFSRCFSIVESQKIDQSERTLYLMQRID